MKEEEGYGVIIHQNNETKRMFGDIMETEENPKGLYVMELMP